MEWKTMAMAAHLSCTPHPSNPNASILNNGYDSVFLRPSILPHRFYPGCQNSRSVAAPVFFGCWRYGLLCCFDQRRLLLTPTMAIGKKNGVGFRKRGFRNLQWVHECGCDKRGLVDSDEGNASELQKEGDGAEGRIAAFGEMMSSAFPVWVAVACIAGLVKPNAFLWIKGRLQMIGITVTMLGMGMTLSLNDFRGALAMPKELLAGVFLQYTIMPLAGALVPQLIKLPTYYAAGLILVSCCPGGTASNVVTYLARGNVALSVLMTASSTFLAVIMTPLLTSKIAGQYVAVDAGALFASTLQVVLLPVLLGASMSHYFPRAVSKISPLAPTVAVITIAAICGSAIAHNASAIVSSGFQVPVAVVTLHAAGFFLGYVLSKLLGFEESTCRTISIEVGMQNSVLGVVLAGQHFSNPLTAVPCAISSVCHSVFGSALAGIWRLSSKPEIPIPEDVRMTESS